MRKGSLPFLCVLIAVAAMVGCGGSSNPAAPSAATGGLKLQGLVMQGAPSASSQPGHVSALDAPSGRITVTLQENSSISTTVSINGTFELDGLPQTGFTLVFSVNGVQAGTITVTPVQGTTLVKIVVQVTTTTVVLLNLELDNENDNENNGTGSTCMIEGGKVGQHIELEGTVDSGTSTSFTLKVDGERSGGLVTVTGNGAQFKCDEDKTTSTSCAASLKKGSKVHVKGTLTSCSSTAATVTATQVEVQKAEGDNGPDE